MAEVQAGRKRKRDEALEEDVNLNARIGGKIHHEKKLVHKACKKAKVFEIQKVVQRLKNERKKNTEDTVVSSYEAQLSCLKTVDDDTIGNSAFRSKILKDHILRTNETVLSCVKELEPHLPRSVQPGSTLAKIQSRLLSSKILSVQVAASVQSLRVLINPALKIQKEDAVQIPRKSKGNLPQSELSEEEKESPPVANDSGWESGTVDVEGSIADDASWETDTGSSRFPHILSDFEARVEGESDEDSDSSGPESIKEPVVRDSGRHKTSNKIKKANSSIVESTFLPSLSVGFIQGSDDSDFDEAAETKAVDLPRKNRRGQRARRAIWEKKYGRHANHKKKEAEELTAAFAKKAAKAQTRNVIKSYEPKLRTVAGRDGAEKELNNVRAAGTKDDKPLHPSWEAKRKQKDKEKGNIVPGQGKKIKF